MSAGEREREERKMVNNEAEKIFVPAFRRMMKMVAGVRWED